MIRRPPRSTRTDTLFPYTTLFRSTSMDWSDRRTITQVWRSAMSPRHATPNSHRIRAWPRSEEHTSELQSLMRISYAVFCLKKQKNNKKHPLKNTNIKTTNQYTHSTDTSNNKNCRN